FLPPARVPKVNRVAINRNMLGLDEMPHVPVIDRVKSVGRQHAHRNGNFPDRLGKETRADLPPAHLVAVDRLAGVPAIFEDWAARRGLDQSGGDAACSGGRAFIANDVFRIEIHSSRADAVEIGPPPAAIEQKLVAKDIRERREASFAVALAVTEDLV